MDDHSILAFILYEWHLWFVINIYWLDRLTIHEFIFIIINLIFLLLWDTFRLPIKSLSLHHQWDFKGMILSLCFWAILDFRRAHQWTIRSAIIWKVSQPSSIQKVADSLFEVPTRYSLLFLIINRCVHVVSEHWYLISYFLVEWAVSFGENWLELRILLWKGPLFSHETKQEQQSTPENTTANTTSETNYKQQDHPGKLQHTKSEKQRIIGRALLFRENGTKIFVQCFPIPFRWLLVTTAQVDFSCVQNRRILPQTSVQTISSPFTGGDRLTKLLVFVKITTVIWSIYEMYWVNHLCGSTWMHVDQWWSLWFNGRSYPVFKVLITLKRVSQVNVQLL